MAHEATRNGPEVTKFLIGASESGAEFEDVGMSHDSIVVVIRVAGVSAIVAVGVVLLVIRDVRAVIEFVCDSVTIAIESG